VLGWLPHDGTHVRGPDQGRAAGRMRQQAVARVQPRLPRIRVLWARLLWARVPWARLLWARVPWVRLAAALPPGAWLAGLWLWVA
jgi:hypothetical protein